MTAPMTAKTTAEIIDGSQIAADIRAEVAEQVRAHLAAGGRPPHPTAVTGGDGPASSATGHHTHTR